MRKLQNSLYITKQGSYLHKKRETLVIEYEWEKVFQLPIHSIEHIFCFGNVLVSPFLIGFCGENNVNLAYFSEYGRYLGRFQGKQSGNILLRKAQYRMAETNPVLIARNIIAAKIQASRKVLQRHIRNHGNDPEMERVIALLGNSVTRLKSAVNLELIRGIEGEAAARYFSVFSHLLTLQAQPHFQFDGRNRRPPRDPINAMLSFLYSVLGNQISGALQSVGLDPQVGFLHADRPGRDSLAQDLLEEFRAWWIDRMVLSLVNRLQVKANDFSIDASGAVQMKDDTRKLLLQTLQQKKQEKIEHPFLGEAVEIGLLPYIQAMLLARHLRGDLAEYPPFLMR
ncbi:type I-C CRISPR-associated endonuclease Cas1c [Pasteurella bettyae]|uniref:type I-C CRISPR-associated endonuclease Cas1c n=1 Tax=Pasteurella bettyae TaxID=752 RepID=UPI003D26A524